MQYKIPVQIENEDPIFLWLSLRQLIIIMIWMWIWYMVYNSLLKQVWQEMAAIPSIIIALIAVIIAIFKQYEMTFVPFVLAILRFNVNSKNRVWQSWTDSFQAIDIWYVTQSGDKKIDNIDFDSKIDKIKKLEDKIQKI